MINIIALSIWIAVIYLTAPSIRKNAALFYIAVTTIAAAALLLPSFQASAPINDGYAALSLWIIIMLAGIPNPLKKLSKKIRLVRTQLSIAAFILTFGHFIHDFIISFELPILTAFISLFIMTPLFVTSFYIVRRRFDGKQWKKMHRWAYPAYVLMLFHVMLVTKSFVNLAFYSIVLLLYVFHKFKSSKPVFKAAKLCLLAIILLAIGKSLLLQTQLHDIQKSDGDLRNMAGCGNIYEDGTYTGTANGYGPDLTVEVSLKDSSITEISIVDHNERGESYFMPAFDAIPARIIEKQSASVDAVSGSTYTSYGIMNATSDALSKAIVSGELEEPIVEEVHNGKGKHRNK